MMTGVGSAKPPKLSRAGAEALSLVIPPYSELNLLVSRLNRQVIAIDAKVTESKNKIALF